MNTIIKYNGAARQDAFALNVNKFKTDGYFLEFGSQHPTNDNNTYLLESGYNWKGLMFEWEDKYIPLYEKERSEDTTYIIADATQLQDRKAKQHVEAKADSQNAPPRTPMQCPRAPPDACKRPCCVHQPLRTDEQSKCLWAFVIYC